jgi:hypothetical protein
VVVADGIVVAVVARVVDKVVEGNVVEIVVLAVL